MDLCLPQPFVDKIHALFGEKANAILYSFEQKRATSIRINTLKTSKEEIEHYFNNNSIHYKWIEAIRDAAILPELSSRAITFFPPYQEGKIYIQSLSSMIPVMVLDPQPGEQILDMAAAPGSKTSQIAAYTHNQAVTTANDIDRKRLYKLKSILEQQGANQITITNIPGQSMWQKYPEYFDRVLLDAPCSMESRFDCLDKSSYEQWSPRKVKNLARLQQWLLRSAVSATKVGGTIVYSTCTLSPEENEGVISWILDKEKGAVELEEIHLSGIETVDGFISVEKKQYGPELIKTKRILPSSLYEGFYVAKLKKVKANVKTDY